MSSLPPPYLPVRSVVQARASIVVFLVALIALTWVALLIPDRASALAIYAYAAAPACAAVLARLVCKEGLGGMGWSLSGRHFWQAMLLAFALPVLVGLLAYAPLWLAGIVSFAPHRLPHGMPVSASPALNVVLWMASGSLITLIFALPTALGEEIGWRGHLLLRLVEAEVPAPVLLSGLIWGLWHFPLILLGLYDGVGVAANSILQMTCFLVGIVAAGYIFATMRLGAGSLIPVIVGHAWWNAVTQAALNPVSQGVDADRYVGEGGVVTAVALVLIAFGVQYFWSGAAATRQRIAEAGRSHDTSVP